MVNGTCAFTPPPLDFCTFKILRAKRRIRECPLNPNNLTAPPHPPFDLPIPVVTERLPVSPQSQPQFR